MSSQPSNRACHQARLNLRLHPSLQPESPGQGPGLGTGARRRSRSDQKPSFCSHRRTGPGGLPVSPLQLAANGWCAESFFAVTSEALGSPLTARARASFVAR